MFRLAALLRLAGNDFAVGHRAGALENCLVGRSVHVTSSLWKDILIKGEKIQIPKTVKLTTLEGEKMGVLGVKGGSEFPDNTTMDKVFNGIPFKHLPIINVKSTPNNTVVNFTDSNGKPIMTTSAGVEGFKHAKKGTNVAAQQTAFNFGMRIVNSGTRTVRVKIQGLANGRSASIKGLLQAGMEIVSITDDTRISWNPPRPRKARRI